LEYLLIRIASTDIVRLPWIKWKVFNPSFPMFRLIIVLGSKRGKSLSGRKANGCHRLIFSILAIVVCLGLLDWLHYGRTTR
jgi:hypothetical protein